MIDILSNSNVLAPQIDFLLFLQAIRAHFPYAINKIFLSITLFGEFWLPTIICAVVYWSISTKKGMYLFLLLGFNFLFSQVLKMAACVYRPWVLSDKIKPVKEAVFFAKGYSFPSGHSSMASSNLGGVALLLKNKISLALICLVLIVGFSRLWLGVHTPQDVIVGLALGFTLVVVAKYIIEWLENNKKRYFVFGTLFNLFIFLSVVYVCFINKYPIDYADGEILVNPYSSIRASMACFGYAFGIINGCILSRLFFPFNPKEGSFKSRILRSVIGSVFVLTSIKITLPHCFSEPCCFHNSFLIMMLTGLFITLIYPIIFVFAEKYAEKAKEV